MKKYKIQELIESKKIEVNSLNEDYKENVDLIKTLSSNYSKEDADARTLDEEMVDAMKSDGTLKKTPEKKPTEKKKPAEKKPTEKKKPASPSHRKLDKDIDGIVGKKIYFKSDDGHWVSGTIVDGFNQHKDQKDKWVIEYYPPGGKSKFDFPLVTPVLTTDQLQQLIDGETVKDHTLKKPNSPVINDFNEASKEIDECLEKSKTERAERKSKEKKPPKKTPKVELDDKTDSYVSGVSKLTDDPKKAAEVKKTIEACQTKIRKILFG